MGSEKLLKQVFDIWKPITGNMPTTWCGSTRKLLFDLCLGHVWSSESVGPSKDWEKVISASLRAREVHEWKEGLQRKSKLRLYRTLKNDLRRESYLTLPLESRRKLTEMRSGTHSLRIDGTVGERAIGARHLQSLRLRSDRGRAASPVGLLPLRGAKTGNVPDNPGQD